jgi:hypothetical protein
MCNSSRVDRNVDVVRRRRILFVAEETYSFNALSMLSL